MVVAIWPPTGKGVGHKNEDTVGRVRLLLIALTSLVMLRATDYIEVLNT